MQYLGEVATFLGLRKRRRAEDGDDTSAYEAAMRAPRSALADAYMEMRTRAREAEARVKELEVSIAQQAERDEALHVEPPPHACCEDGVESEDGSEDDDGSGSSDGTAGFTPSSSDEEVIPYFMRQAFWVLSEDAYQTLQSELEAEEAELWAEQEEADEAAALAAESGEDSELPEAEVEDAATPHPDAQPEQLRPSLSSASQPLLSTAWQALGLSGPRLGSLLPPIVMPQTLAAADAAAAAEEPPAPTTRTFADGPFPPTLSWRPSVE